MSPRTSRGIRIHKLIRLMTIGLGGEGYLNFMGNEFGHPEWIDFPRHQNNWSYDKCRRQWHLEDEDHTRYHDLGLFDADLMALNAKYEWNLYPEFTTRWCNLEKMICWERGNLLFVVSLHPFNGDYQMVCPVRYPGKYTVVFSTN